MRAAAATLASALMIGGLLAAPSQAQMRGPSLSCNIADSNIVLDMFLPLASDGGGGGGRSGMQGVLEVNHYKMAKDRRRFALDGRQPSQMWNVGNDLKLRLLLGTGEALVDLIIETTERVGTNGHLGSFRLETGEGVRVQGRIQCHVG